MVLGSLCCVVLAGSGCGGPCEYRRTTGTARVTAIQSSAGGNACSNGVNVLFDFTPSDATQTELAATNVEILVGDGKSPPRSWVESSGLTVGSVHPATRSDMTSGSCSPMIISLDDVDYAAGTNACFSN